MPEEKKSTKHHIHIEEREQLKMGGVLEVIAFDEEGVLLETTSGLLHIKGAGLHMGKLDLDLGEIVIKGLIDSLTYTESGYTQKQSLLGKLFR